MFDIFFYFWRDRSFSEMTDMIFIDIDAVAVWHTLTKRVHEYLCGGVQEYSSTWVREYMSTEKMST